MSDIRLNIARRSVFRADCKARNRCWINGDRRARRDTCDEIGTVGIYWNRLRRSAINCIRYDQSSQLLRG